MSIRTRRKTIVAQMMHTLLLRRIEHWLTTADPSEMEMFERMHSLRWNFLLETSDSYKFTHDKPLPRTVLVEGAAWPPAFIPEEGVVLAVEDVQVEAAKQEFVVQKVSNGEVVNTFDTREDALNLVLKHIRQKKAKLHVMDSSTGNLVLFTAEELQAWM